MLGISFVFALVTGYLVTSRRVTDPDSQTPRQLPESVRLAQEYQVVRSQPSELVDEVSSQPTLLVQFNKETSAVKVEIKLDPVVGLSMSTSENNLIHTAVPQDPLQPNTRYTATVYLNGHKFYQWEFKTTEKVLTSADLNALIKLKQTLPYQGSHFRIIYNATLDEFQVIIDSKPINTYYQNALNWIRSQGLNDVTAIKIQQYPVGAALRP